MAATVAADPLTLRSEARMVQVDPGTLPEIAVPVRDPTDGNRKKTLLGPRLADLLPRLAPPAGADAITVRCNDGWFSLIALATLRRFGGAIIAVRERTATGDRAVAPPRGPNFLAWPNVEQPAIDRDPELSPNGWTWGVAEIAYARAADFALPISAAAPVAARQGVALFTAHCQHCHEIDGRGGRVGWDLSEPDVLTYRTEAYVRAYIQDPRRRNPASHMPAFRKQLTPADLDALVSYFRSVAKKPAD